jgi:hypothetical protein
VASIRLKYHNLTKLYAIDAELSNKGMSKSENPDLLINIFTKEREKSAQISLMLVGAMVGDGDGILTCGRTANYSYIIQREPHLST